MVKIDRTKQKLFSWLAGPLTLLALVSVIVGLFNIASILFMAIVSLIIVAQLYSKFYYNPSTTFSYIKNGKLIIIPHAYLLNNPIEIETSTITTIKESGIEGKRKFLIQSNNKDITINLHRMLGLSFNIKVEKDFLSFLNKSIREVEHAYTI